MLHFSLILRRRRRRNQLVNCAQKITHQNFCAAQNRN